MGFHASALLKPPRVPLTAFAKMGHIVQTGTLGAGQFNVHLRLDHSTSRVHFGKSDAPITQCAPSIRWDRTIGSDPQKLHSARLEHRINKKQIP